MKRRQACACLAALCLLLTGCAQQASQPEETVVPMREESSSIPDLDEDFGSQKSSSSLIDIEADDK